MKYHTTLLALAWLALGADAAPRPNIVLIMADDLGYGDLGCYGNRDIDTPHIDGIAANGVRFTDFHSNGTVCSPTRAALMTGRYQQRTGVEGVITAKGHRDTGLPPAETTIAEMLGAAGYSTAIFGKWHLGYDIEKFGPLRQGFETFEGFLSGNVDYFSKIDQEAHKDWWIGEDLRHVDGYVTDLINDRAVDWIRRHQRRKKDAPFFLYLSHAAPHYPLQGPDDVGFRELGKKQVLRNVAKPRPIYKKMIESMDAGIGRVLDAIEQHELTDNTLVIFCSDNGPWRFVGSAGGLRGAKGTVYEGGHRVPMVMQWPGRIEPGSENDSTVMSMDLFKGFAGLAGAGLPEGVVLDGIDIGKVVSEGHAPERTLHWAFRDHQAMRQGPWKLILNGRNRPELYHLDDDPGERDNLADQYPERVKEMTALHRQWLEETREGTDRVS